MRILLTRPRHESEALAQMLIEMGHEVLIEPLLSIVPDADVSIESINPPQAIIITSVNGARAFSAHARAGDFTQIPVFAVGTATADALERFNVVHLGNDGVAALIDTIHSKLIPEGGRLLYIRGVHVAGNLASELTASGYCVDQVVVYEAVEKQAFSAPIVEGFRSNRIDGVVLFSPRTAQVFSKLIEKADLNEKLNAVTFYCLSQNVSDSIEISGFKTDNHTVISSAPTLKSLISSIGN